MVVRFGIPGSLRLAQVMHGTLFICLILFGLVSGLVRSTLRHWSWF